MNVVIDGIGDSFYIDCDFLDEKFIIIVIEEKKL